VRDFPKNLLILFVATCGSGPILATQLPPPTTGLEVDTSSRTAVLAFWNAYYKTSEGSEAVMGWSGSHQTCNAGSNSLAYTEMVERRINFYRALAGMDANTVTNSGSTVVIGGSNTYKPSASVTKQSGAQAAALMFSWADQVSHQPPPSAPFYCWSTSAWNAAYHSNLAVGFCGPEAVDAYMRENDPVTLSSWNSQVGHRRWILKHGATDFASGDVPGNSSQFRSTNVLYVAQSSDELVDLPARFTAWPSEGYFPDQLMATQWSLSHPGASFSSATVSMTEANGASIATTLIDRTTTNLADPAIVWSVPVSVASSDVSEDTTYHVTVSGIQVNGTTVSHSYEVNVFDPDVLGEDLSLLGTPNPPVDGATYFFETVEGADEYKMLASESEAVNWVAGAENGASDYIIDDTEAGYALRTTAPYVYEGTRSFRLRLPAPGPGYQESFTIDREVIPGPGATISYRRKRGYMGPGELFEVQISSDGILWTTIDSIGGRSTATVDPSFTLRTMNLVAGLPVRIRAVLSWQSGSSYVPSDSRTGIFLDEFSFTNCEWATSTVEIDADPVAGRARLDPSTLGGPPSQGSTLRLRLQADVGGVEYVSTQPLTVTFGGTINGFSDWVDANYPTLTGGFDGDPDMDGIASGVEYAFGLSPLQRSSLPMTLSRGASSLSLTTPLDAQREGVIYQLEHSSNLSDWSTSGTSVNLSGGQLTGSAPSGSEKGFVRWKIVEP